MAVLQPRRRRDHLRRDHPALRAGGATIPQELVVAAADAGQRLDVYLAAYIGSRAAAQKAIDGGLVLVDGQPRQKRFTVAAGQAVHVSTMPEAEAARVPDAAFEVAYEDEHLLVVDKPAGVVVHPGHGNRQGTLVQALGDRVAGGEDPDRPGVVHRLDRDTSGLLILARTQPAWERLSDLIRHRAVTREYVALVDGRPPARAGTIDAPLGRDRRRRMRQSTDTDDPREAITHFEITEAYDRATLLRVRLQTGRTHQIRAHLEAIGHRVIGDPEYGVPGPEGLSRQFLHADHLAFTHPLTGDPIDVRSPLPQDLQAALRCYI